MIVKIIVFLTLLSLVGICMAEGNMQKAFMLLHVTMSVISTLLVLIYVDL